MAPPQNPNERVIPIRAAEHAFGPASERLRVANSFKKRIAQTALTVVPMSSLSFLFFHHASEQTAIIVVIVSSAILSQVVYVFVRKMEIESNERIETSRLNHEREEDHDLRELRAKVTPNLIEMARELATARVPFQLDIFKASLKASIPDSTGLGKKQVQTACATPPRASRKIVN